MGLRARLTLSHLAGRGVFKAWNDRDCFEAVRIAEYDAVAWSEELELCPYARYMQLTGKALDEVMPQRPEQGQWSWLPTLSGCW